MPAVRYSEDVDLVQVKAGAIGPLMDEIRAVLNPWLGSPKYKPRRNAVSAVISLLPCIIWLTLFAGTLISLAS